MRIGDQTLQAQVAPILSEEWLIGILMAALLALVLWQVRRAMARIDEHERTVRDGTHAVEMIGQRVTAIESELQNLKLALMAGVKETGRNEAEHAEIRRSLDYMGGALNQLVFGPLPNKGPHDGGPHSG